MPPHPCLLLPGEKAEFTFEWIEPLYNYPPLNFTRDFGQECSCPLFSPTATR